MLSIVKGNLFKKQHESLFQLESVIKNLLKIREVNVYRNLLAEYKKAVDSMIGFAVTIDECFALEEAEGETADLYKRVDALWRVTLENRRQLEKAAHALRTLQYETELLLDK